MFCESADQPAQQPSPKSNKGLIISLIAGAAVIAVVLILVLVVFPGGSSEIMGKWYDESGFAMFEFMGGGKCKITIGVEFDATYTFDSKSKEGEVAFSVPGMTEKTKYWFVMLGMWQKTEFSLSDDGKLTIMDTAFSRTPVELMSLKDMFGDVDIDFEYDLE